MANFADIERALSEDSPCGPDPELDPEIQNFLAVAEGQLPASYRDFNRKAFDARGTLQRIHESLGKSRDIRFIVLAAKNYILSDDLEGFSDSIAALNKLLSAQWDHCHPTEAAGGPVLRAAFLKSLDDMPTSILPLQHATLVFDKRLGSISMRSILVAARKVPGRAEEPALDTDAIRDAFLRVEPFDELLAVQARVEGILTALREIRQIFIDKAGYEVAPQFEQLPELLTSISTYLADIIRERAPVPDQEPSVSGDEEPGMTDEAQADGATAGSQCPEDIRTVGEAANALEAILGYYAASEPSSPARLLIKQAHQLVGKTFVEAMRVLAPGMAEETRIRIGGDSPFSLDFSQLSALADEETAPEGASDEARRYSASTRADATALMRKVEQFYRSTEPSSPIPLLVERARNFVAKDFASLLKEMARRDENN